MTLSDKTLFLVCGTLSAGGAERIISVISTHLANYFFKVEVMMWREAPVFYHLDSRIKQTIIPKEANTKVIVKQMFWFRNYVKNSAPCCVISFLAPFNMLTIASLWKSQIPLLIADRNDPRYDCPNMVWRFIRNYLYGLATRLCVQTQHNKNYFSPSIRQKTDIIYNPVFLAPNMIGAALNSHKTKTIVSIGRLNQQKKFELLLKAFAKVVKTFPDHRLIIYGEGELRAKLEQKIEILGLKGLVKLPGTKKNIHQLLLNAELFVMSSDYEGMSNALIEAMCLGLSCISTKVSGATDFIQNGINGGLIEVGDEKALTDQMIYFLSNQEKSRKMAKEAIKIRQDLEMNCIINQWLQSIQKALGNKLSIENI